MRSKIIGAFRSCSNYGPLRHWPFILNDIIKQGRERIHFCLPNLFSKVLSNCQQPFNDCVRGCKWFGRGDDAIFSNVCTVIVYISCVHMAVLTPPSRMKFDIDWYCYLKVLEKLITCSFYARVFQNFKSRQGCRTVHMGNVHPAAQISTSGPAALHLWTQQNLNR